MRAAVRASPRSSSFVALAHALCDDGQLEEAQAVCLQGLSHHPDLPTGQVALARACLDAGQTAQAETRLLDIIRRHPHHVDAYRYLAKVMALTGRRREAIAMLTRMRSEIVQAQDLPALLESLTGDPHQEGGQPEAQVARVTAPHVLAGRVGERRQGDRRRESDEPRPPAGDAVPVPIARPSAVDPREFVAAASTPPRRVRRDTMAPSKRSPTPTDSFPPIAPEESIRIDLPPARSQFRRSLTVGVPALVILVLGGWSLHSARTLSGGGSAGEVAIEPVSPPAATFEQAAAEIEADLAAGSLQRLLRARNLGQKRLAESPSDQRARINLAFVVGLLAMDHGITVEQNEAQRLTAQGSKRADWSTLMTAQGAAAKALLALGDGDQLAAEEAVRAALAAAPDDRRVLLAAVATRYRSGDIAAAVAALARQPHLGETWGAARPTLAALQIDRGRLDAAVAVLDPALSAGSDDALTLLLSDEVHRTTRGPSRKTAAGQGIVSDLLTKACARDGQPSPTVRAACAVNQAVERRLAGDRAGALADARHALGVHSSNPRVLGALAQLLANLGETDEAALAAESAGHQASALFPALAWANVAIAIGRGVPAAPPAGIQAGGSESRLVAARAMEPNAPAPDATDADPDLRWLSSLGMSGNRRRMIRFVQSVEQHADRSPVAAYVAGTLAFKAGRRRLAARWLAEALTGHGDACRAMREYRIVLHGLKQNDRLDEAQALLAQHNSRCASL